MFTNKPEAALDGVQLGIVLGLALVLCGLWNSVALLVAHAWIVVSGLAFLGGGVATMLQRGLLTPVVRRVVSAVILLTLCSVPFAAHDYWRRVAVSLRAHSSAAAEAGTPASAQSHATEDFLKTTLKKFEHGDPLTASEKKRLQDLAVKQEIEQWMGHGSSPRPQPAVSVATSRPSGQTDEEPDTIQTDPTVGQQWGQVPTQATPIEGQHPTGSLLPVYAGAPGGLARRSPAGPGNPAGSGPTSGAGGGSSLNKALKIIGIVAAITFMPLSALAFIAVSGGDKISQTAERDSHDALASAVHDSGGQLRVDLTKFRQNLDALDTPLPHQVLSAIRHSLDSLGTQLNSADAAAARAEVAAAERRLLPRARAAREMLQRVGAIASAELNRSSAGGSKDSASLKEAYRRFHDRFQKELGRDQPGGTMTIEALNAWFGEQHVGLGHENVVNDVFAIAALEAGCPVDIVATFWPLESCGAVYLLMKVPQ